MNNYTFETLNDKEFEEIVKDLLTKKLDLDFRSFPKGRDKGIDLRFSTPENENAIVVQVKHYPNSGYAQLKQSLNKEVPKVSKLNVDRYIIATCLPLTVGQKDELMTILSPYVKTSHDIYSQQDLNDIISNYPDVERKFYKLWLSSVTIIESILNNAVESRTRYFLEKVTEKMKFFVATNKVNLANKILKNEKVLLIRGEPGVGKTTLADILILDRAKEGYRVHVIEDIIEAESIMSQNKEEKQVFYFDDFLGSNYTEIINSHKTETRLTSFVERVASSPNKYLILTTRTVILSYANEIYEKIARSRLNAKRFEIVVSDYNAYEKALILYNHLYFKGLDESYMRVITEDKFYLDIIKHRSYRPRLIEFITDISKIGGFKPVEYKQFVLNSLKNPSNIWYHSFQNQITYLDRCLLLSLFSMGNSCQEEELIAVYDSRLTFERNENNQRTQSNQFNQSIRVLLDGFVTLSIYDLPIFTQKQYQFINPSLADFLLNYVSGSLSEKEGIVKSSIYSKQLERFNPEHFFNTIENGIEKKLQMIILAKIENDEFIDLRDNNSLSISKKIDILWKYCPNLNIDTNLLQSIEKININESWYDYVVKTLIYMMNRLNKKSYPLSYNYVSTNFTSLIQKLFVSTESHSYALQLVGLFDKYGYSYDDFKESEEGFDCLNEYIENFIRASKDESLNSLENEILEMREIEDSYNEINETKDNLLSDLRMGKLLIVKDLKPEVSFWEERINENFEKEKARENERREYDYERNLNKPKTINYDKEIERLFAR